MRAAQQGQEDQCCQHQIRLTSYGEDEQSDDYRQEEREGVRLDEASLHSAQDAPPARKAAATPFTAPSTTQVKLVRRPAALAAPIPTAFTMPSTTTRSNHATSRDDRRRLSRRPDNRIRR